MSKDKSLYIFLGPPGSGKGTLSQMCTQKLGFKQLSTGSLCRKHIAEGSPLGCSIDFAIKSGKLISDDLIIEMVKDWLLTQVANFPGVILDGFPRTVSQATALLDLVQKQLQDYSLHVVKFAISNERIVERLSTRVVCQNKDCQAVFGSAAMPLNESLCDFCSGSLSRRSDDQALTVRKRIDTYYVHEKPLVDFFSSTDVIVSHLNVDRSIQEVFSEFEGVIK